MTDGADRTADELEVRNVLAALAQSADAGDTATYIGLLTDDVVWDMPSNPAVGLSATQLEGRAAIAAAQRQRIASGVQGPGSDTMHVVTTTTVDLDGDRAVADSSFLFLADTSSAPAIRSAGRYHDVLRRTAEGWRLVHRTITFG